MARKGENIFRRKDGRWEARYIHHYDAEGKAVYRFIYGRSYSEVKEKKRVAQATPEIAAVTVGEIPTLEILCGKWLAEIRFTVKESTYTRYHRAICKYILPRMGDLAPSRLDAARVNAFAEELLLGGGMRSAPLSAKTVTDIVTVLKSVMKYGIVCGEVNSSLEGIKLPKRERKKITILAESVRTNLEVELMRSVDPTAVGVMISLFTGMRLGEICGLRWGDIDFKNRTVTVERTVERIANLDLYAESKTKVIICEPKTESSIRLIPISKFLTGYLKNYESECIRSEEWAECYILTGSSEPCEPNKFYSRYKRLMRRLGFGNYTFHALRHTFATRCVAVGFDTKSLAEILGHSNIATTLSVYVHPTIEQKRAQMDKLKPPMLARA